MKNYRGVRKWLNAVLVLGVAGMLTFAGCTAVDDTLGYELVPGNQQMEMRLHSIRKGFEARMFMSDSVKSSNLPTAISVRPRATPSAYARPGS